jgi:hypothetical protein
LLNMSEWFCTLTNLMCVLPTWYAHRVCDKVLYLGTGLVSILYHLNLPKTIIDYHAIRFVDLVLSDICIYWTVTIPDKYKDNVLMITLPIELYITRVGYPYVRLYLVTVWVLVNLVRIVIFKKVNVNRKFLGCTMATSILDLTFYEGLRTVNYNWFHGLHHIFGFLSIYLYNRTAREPVSPAPSPSHRRIVSDLSTLDL